MKARQIIFLLTIVFLFTFTSLPYSGLKSVYAQPPPPDKCGVWFPYVINASGFDTLITITGNAGESGAELMIYFYGLDGSYQGAADVINLAAGEHSQWGDILYHINPGFVGSILMVTDMTDVRASGLIKNIVGTGALINTPAVIDYNISGVDTNHRITGFPEPEEFRTTLVFPHIVNVTGYDTGFSIGGPYYDGCSGRTATLYLYDTEGVLRRIVIVAMDPATGGSVHPTYGCTLSGLLAIDTEDPLPPVLYCEDVNDGFLTSDVQGFMIAVLNFPYAQGCEFFSIPNVGTATGFAATVDNDITDEIILEPWRLESDVDHSSIVLPCVRTSSALQAATFVTLANTCDGTAVTADIYLFDLDGSIKTIDDEPCYWQVVLGGDNNMPEMATIFLSTSLVQVNGVTQEYASLEDLNDFTGWMLIITDAPGSYAEATIAAGNNSFMSYAGQNDPDIIDVGLCGIVRAEPLPLDTVEAVALPYFANDLGFTTWVNVISTADWNNGGEGTPLPYTIKTYDHDGDTLDDIPPVDVFPGPVLSASGIQQVPYQGEPATWGNNIIYGPPNLSAFAVLLTEDDIEGGSGTTITFTLPNVPSYLPVMPRGEANEQTITLIAPKAVTWQVVNNNGDPATDAKFRDGQNWVTTKAGVNQIQLSAGPNPSAADNDVTINVTEPGEAAVPYQITIVKITSVDVDASDTKTHKIPSNLQNGKDHFCTVKGQGNSVLICTIEPDTAGARNALVWKSGNVGVPVTSPALNNDKRTTKYSRGTAAKIPINIVIAEIVTKELCGWVIWMDVAVSNQGKDNPDVVDLDVYTFIHGGYDFEYTINPPSIITDEDRPELSGNKTGGPPPTNGLNYIDQPLINGANLKWDSSRKVHMEVNYDGTCNAYIYTIPLDEDLEDETFTVSNGLTVKVFEFDMFGDGVAPGNIEVDIQEGDSGADGLRDAIIRTINSVTGFGVSAESAGAGKVRLYNNESNETGIVAVSESVSDDHFVVQSITVAGGGVDITHLAAPYLQNGETFTIFNGTTSTVFEFQKTGGQAAPGHVLVALGSGDDREAVGLKIAAAINGAGIDKVIAARDNESPYNVLVANVNDILTATDTVANETFITIWVNVQDHIGKYTKIAYPSTGDADGRPGGAEGVTAEELDVVGNDDSEYEGEDNNPYDQLKYIPPVLPEAKGKIYGQDDPGSCLVNKFGAVGNKFQLHAYYKEFARIELGGKWYRCSDEKLWKVYFNFKKVTEAGKQKWVDDPDEGMESTKAQDNEGWEE